MKKLNLIIILSMIIGMMLFSTANAGTFHWIGITSTNWSDPTNWLEGSVPGNNDEVIFDIDIPNRDCLLDISTTIAKLTINNLYGSQLILPNGNSLSITGDVSISASPFAWDNTTNIILIGDADQTITIDDPFGDFWFNNLTINKPSGNIILGSDIIITGVLSNISGTTIIDNGFSIIGGGCIAPQTGNIYTISNSWGL